MSEARPEAIVLSPHMNDAVLSCAGWILDQAKQRHRPLVVTVFSHSTVQANAVAQRTQEQRQR
ncbi:MAG: hypothetical protein ACOC1F_03290, partial [Myxococcota bacterium]